MVTVAVAGGTGDLGRTIVDALKESPNHKVIVLARQVSKHAICCTPSHTHTHTHNICSEHTFTHTPTPLTTVVISISAMI
jgi:nucleoside-diphosphate-sugar epimerase